MRISIKFFTIAILLALVVTVSGVSILAADAQVSLSKDKFTKAEAEEIIATYSNVTGGQPWIGLYHRDTVPAPGTGSALAWKDISAGNGTFDLKGLQDAAAWEAATTGDYKLCIFSDYDPVDGVYPLIAEVNFSIIDSTPTLSLNKTTFTKAEVEEIVATYENVTGSQTWMGIYDRNDTPGAGEVKSLAWKDIPSGSGTFDFSNLSDADDWNNTTKGEFKICVFANYDKVDGIYPILAQVDFTLVEETGGEEGPGTEEPGTEPVTDTGDNFGIIAVAFVLLALSGAGVLFLKKQKA